MNISCPNNYYCKKKKTCVDIFLLYNTHVSTSTKVDDCVFLIKWSSTNTHEIKAWYI